MPTAFASQALTESYLALKNEEHLAAAGEICEFILSGLKRPVETEDEVCFSYTPVDNNVIYNANLLAGESLARVGAITGNAQYLEVAAKTVRFVVRRQRSDGAWVYGSGQTQGWADNFHTAYVLQSLHRISSAMPSLRAEISGTMASGVEYWLQNFFTFDGAPKYYDNSVHPIDVHSAAVAIVALCEMRSRDERMRPAAEKTVKWTVDHMLDPKGFFYYQVRRGRVIKTPFMRWGQAWMAYALARFVESGEKSN